MTGDQLYDLYVEHIWLKIPEVYRDEIDQCEVAILAGIKIIIQEHERLSHSRGGLLGVSTEGASWAMEADDDH